MLNVLLFVNDRLVPKAARAHLREVYDRADYYGSRLRLGRDIFTQIEIETNTDCNRKCRICPRHKNEREVGVMPAELFEALLGQLQDIDFRGRVSPVFYNEPLLDDRLVTLMRATRTRLPRCSIVVFTNGSLLTRQNIEALVDAGVDTLLVSQYQQNLRADAATWAAAVQDLPLSYRRHVRYRILGDEDPLSTSGGLVPVRVPVTRSRCMQASLSCVVDFRGNVVLCCNDYFGDHVLGNVGTEHVVDIWNRPAFVELRKQLRHGDFRREICQACAQGTLRPPQSK